MSEDLKELYFRIIQLSDDELSQMVNVEYDEYRPEALKFAREEMQRRGLQIEPASEASPPAADVNFESDSRGQQFDETTSAMPGPKNDAEPLPEVRFEIFRSGVSSWNTLFAEAANFASRIGPLDLINISHSEDTNEGVVTVWYWYR
jgi:hypothetical protein